MQQTFHAVAIVYNSCVDVECSARDSSLCRISDRIHILTCLAFTRWVEWEREKLIALVIRHAYIGDFWVYRWYLLTVKGVFRHTQKYTKIRKICDPILAHCMLHLFVVWLVQNNQFIFGVKFTYRSLFLVYFGFFVCVGIAFQQRAFNQNISQKLSNNILFTARTNEKHIHTLKCHPIVRCSFTFL